MKNIILLLTMTFPLSTVLSQPLVHQIDTLVNAYHQNRNFNGSVLVAEKGTIILNKGYGLKNIATQAPNDSNTIFQVGSITKQFTSAVILQLVRQKRLTLQDKLSKFIPDYPKGDEITIEELLTHTAGVFNYTNDHELVRKHMTTPIALDSLIALFKYKPLDFVPGSQYSYSNSNYILLGYIIERVTGRSWFQNVRERIFIPLQMTHSGFDFKGLVSGDKATGYQSTVGALRAQIVDSTVSFSAGCIYSTTGDLYKWDRALYTDRILDTGSLAEAFTPHLSQYGYGWVIGTLDGRKLIEHGGSIPGFVSLIRRIPEEDICIIILTNQPLQTDIGKVANDITAILHGKEYTLPKEHVEIHPDTTVLRQYTGVYQLTPALTMTITLENGILWVQLTGQNRLQLFAEKTDYFFLKLVDAQIEFVRGDDHAVRALILHHNNRDQTASRVK